MKWRDGLGIIRSADSRSEGDYVAPWIADASLHPRFSGDFMALPRVLSSPLTSKMPWAPPCKSSETINT